MGDGFVNEADMDVHRDLRLACLDIEAPRHNYHSHCEPFVHILNYLVDKRPRSLPTILLRNLKRCAKVLPLLGDLVQFGENIIEFVQCRKCSAGAASVAAHR